MSSRLSASRIFITETWGKPTELGLEVWNNTKQRKLCVIQMQLTRKKKRFQIRQDSELRVVYYNHSAMVVGVCLVLSN